MKTISRMVVSCVALLSLLVVPFTSRAAPFILSGFMGDPGNHEYWGVAGQDGSSYLAASALRTDGQSYSLNSITVKLRSELSYNSIPELAIFSNSMPYPNKPSVKIGTLTGPSTIPHSDFFHDYTFTANGIDLQPYSNYWVVLNSTNGGIEWLGCFGSEHPLSYWSGVGFSPVMLQSRDGGQTWENWIGYFQGAQCMTVVADTECNTVPEPATILLLGPGIAWMLRRRFKN